MKTALLSMFTLLLSLGISSSVAAQEDAYICFDEWGYDPYCVFRIEPNGTVWYQEDGMRPEAILSFDGTRVYNGPDKFPSAIAYTIFGNKIYRGSSTFSKNCAFNVVGDRIYRGDSFFDKDIVYTIYNDQLYAGNSVSSSDLRFTLDDPDGVLTQELIAIIVSSYVHP